MTRIALSQGVCHIVAVFICYMTIGKATTTNANKTYCVNESSVVWNYAHEPSIIGTFVNCIANVQDAMLAPYYARGQIINVSTAVFLNNLISVDEVTTSVTLDFFFMNEWVSYICSICD